jgi:hypothetical protein
MTEQFYIIPMAPGPYSATNKQRPDYVEAVGCLNWHGAPVFAFDVYVCRINTTPARHADLASRAGVRQFPAGVTWDTVISALTNLQQNFVSNVCSQLGIAFDASETVGGLLSRILFSANLSFGNISTTTQYNALTQIQRDGLAGFAQRWGLQPPGANETIKNMTGRMGAKMWNGSLPILEEL